MMLLITILMLLMASSPPALGDEKFMHRHVVMDRDYSIHEAPVNRHNPNEPLDVQFSINLRNVLGVNEKEQLISLEISLRMFWKDYR